MEPSRSTSGRTASAVADVFWVALKLGLTSFGGPIAHLGYFERTYVRQKQWLTLEELAGLIALCQILPGPTSSQVGFLIGQRRAGLAGACAAWAGFTAPSALLMLACALWAPRLPVAPTAAILQGLKWVAVMVVAQAVWQMARALCPDWPRATVALLGATWLLFARSAMTPLLILAAGAAIGACLAGGRVALPSSPAASPGERRLARTGAVAFASFVALLGLLLLNLHFSTTHSLPVLIGLLYRTGSLVFGGGHVVLPLLRDALVPSGWLTDDQFLAGYGAAQALPGPLFAFSAYVGALVAPPGSAVAWAFIALTSLFVPGLLLSLAAVSVRGWLERHATARAALAGVNAAVVGVLAAALINPVSASAIHDLRDFGIVAVGFLALQRWHLAPIALVVLSVMVAMLMTALH
jgi:chromate transporter